MKIFKNNYQKDNNNNNKFLHFKNSFNYKLSKIV